MKKESLSLFVGLSLAATALPLPGQAAGTWADRSTACVAAITPAFLASVFKNPAGASTDKNPPGDDGCTTGVGDDVIKFQLRATVSSVQFDDVQKKYHSSFLPLAGVGDKALFAADGSGLDAWKSNRSCDVVAIPLDPGNLKINGKALATKLGEICNQLLALP